MVAPAASRATVSPARPEVRPGLRRMLEARSVAVVGASERPDSLGLRMATEVLRSPGLTRVHFVSPTRKEVLDRPCVPSLLDVPEPVDLVLLGVPDPALVEQVRLAARRGDAGAVVFGAAHGLTDELAAAADGLEIVGSGCMGFVNAVDGVRAIGYLEPDPVPAGPIALVTHSGSVFSALLRTHRALGFTTAVSSGRELVTTTADYLAHALTRPETGVVGLVLETVRDLPGLTAVLAEAAARDIPVVALTVGTSQVGQALVEAHSGALAGSDGGWEALFAAYGVHRVSDLAELVDSLEMFAIGRRPVGGPRSGIATVHDSGAERVLVADVAHRLGVPFAPLATATRDRLEQVLDPGLAATNPLDVWGTGRDTEDLFTECLAALADDPEVDAVALAVDLVPEYDGDESFPRAMERLVDLTPKPVAVLANLSSAVDQAAAARLRRRGIPVFEGTASGLRALRHLRTPKPPPRWCPTVDRARRARWAERLASGAPGPGTAEALLADYGAPVADSRWVSSRTEAVAAAAELGGTVVLKTAAGVAHKVDVDGVRLDLSDSEQVAAAYDDLAARLGPAVQVQAQVAAGVELSAGIVRDPLFGWLVVLGVGGTLVELIGQRVVALAPVDPPAVTRMLEGTRLGALLAGARGGPAADIEAVARAVSALSVVGHELGDGLRALEVNPLVAGPSGAVGVDALLR